MPCFVNDNKEKGKFETSHVFLWAGSGSPSPETKCDCGGTTWGEEQKKATEPSPHLLKD